MQEQIFRGTRCQICTGCGRCSGGNGIPVVAGGGQDGITVLAGGGLTAFWQDRIRSYKEKRLIDGGVWAHQGLQAPQGLQPEKKGKEGWLVAVDIGTTTIAMVLYDRGGQERDRFVTVNPQAEYGADVISRIEAAQDASNAARMQESVRAVLEEGIARFRKSWEADASGEAKEEEDHREISGAGADSARMIIAANTTMMYLLAGWDTQELGHAPFHASHLGIAHMCIAGLPTTLLPGLSAFVGADVLAGMYACRMAEQEEITLLVDLGTNGELVLGNRDRRIACATAAGPAFEGGATKGIWGADMVSLLARLLREGILDETGLLPEPYFEGGIRIGNVRITQQHIRQFQAAKAAIAAGIRTLTELYGLTAPEQIDRIVLAGGFGYYLKAEDAARLGLLPKALTPRVISGGNTALTGILRFGFREILSGEEGSVPEKKAESKLKEIADGTEIVNLANVPLFQEYYLDAMYLKEWESRV